MPRVRIHSIFSQALRIFFEQYRALLERGERIVVLHDLTRGIEIPNRKRGHVGNQFKALHDLAHANVIAGAFVTNTLMTRMLLRAMLILAKTPFPYITSRELDGAERWLRTQLRASRASH